MTFLRLVVSFITRHVGSLLAAVLAIAIAGLVFVNVFPLNVAEFKKISVKQDAVTGGILEYTNEYCQNVQKGTDRTLRRFLVPKDSALVNPIELSSSPEDETQVGAGCRISQPIRIPINVDIPAGEYKLRVKACYDIILRIRCIPVQGESDYFKISKLGIEEQLTIINQKIDQVNTQIRRSGIKTVVNTLYVPTPQLITPPFQDQPEQVQPEAPITPIEPQESCLITIIGIKLVCN